MNISAVSVVSPNVYLQCPIYFNGRDRNSSSVAHEIRLSRWEVTIRAGLISRVYKDNS